jgi:HNH endonuclease
MNLSNKDVERFKKLVVRKRGCWKWIGSRVGSYGRMSVGGRKGKEIRARRISYFLAYGSFDETLSVLHRCDNPECTNPKHLFLGTQADNLADMRSKGRARPGRLFGERNGSAKITRNIARSIHVAPGTVRELAKRFGISKSQVSNISGSELDGGDLRAAGRSVPVGSGGGGRMSVVVGAWRTDHPSMEGGDVYLNHRDCTAHRGRSVVHLSPELFKLLAITLSARFIPYPALDDALYSDREDGGPETSDRLRKVNLCHLRRRVRLLGIEIVTQFGVGLEARVA